MFALLVLLTTASAADARVSLVVVHDGSAPITIDVARAAAKHLYASDALLSCRALGVW